MDNNNYIIHKKSLIKNYIKESFEILYCNDDIDMLCILINRLQNYSHIYSIIQKEILKRNIMNSIMELMEIDYKNIEHILNNVEISKYIIQNINLQYYDEDSGVVYTIFKSVFNIIFYDDNYKKVYKLIDFLIENGIDKKYIFESINVDGMHSDIIKILMYINNKLYIKDMIKDYHLLFWYFEGYFYKKTLKECKFIYDNTIDINYQTGYQNMLSSMIDLLDNGKFKIVKFLIDNGLKFIRPKNHYIFYRINCITLKMYKFILKYNMVDKFILFKFINYWISKRRYDDRGNLLIGLYIDFLEPKLIRYLIFKEMVNINGLRNTKYYKQQKIYRNSKYIFNYI